MSLLPSPDQLSLSEQVAQMVVARTTGHLFDHEIEYPQWEATQSTLERCLGDLGVGGVILLGGSAAEVGLRSQQLQSLAKYPLLIAADIEEGVGQRFSGATRFPPPLALGELTRRDWAEGIAAAEQMGRYTAQEAAAIGLNWLLAPVVDVNNNSANPVINVRAFGQSPELVTPLIQAFIRGAQDFPVLTTAKHFPGHGDTAVDSHLSLPVLNHDYERLRQIELAPFVGAIAAGVDSVMTAHLRLPAIDPQRPATLSKPILTGLLRHDLGFDGLIVTDALVMGSITQHYGPSEAAVLAVEAGADILLMPADVEGAIAAVCEAVQVGRIAAEQVRAAVERIWRAKLKTSTVRLPQGETCHAWEQIEPPPVRLTQLATAPARAAAADLTQSSMRLQNLPLAARSGGHNLILVDDMLNSPALVRTAPAVILPAQHRYQLRPIDPHWAEPKLLKDNPQPTLLQLFIRGNPFRSSAQLTQLAQDYLQILLALDCLAALVLYGSPYVWERFQPMIPADLPGIFTYGQDGMAQALALRSLFGTASASKPVDLAFTD